MTLIEVKKRQQLIDIACQYTGSPLGIIEICKLNGFDLNVELTAGQQIYVPDVAENQEMLDYVNSEGLQIITASNTDKTLFE